MTVIGGMPLITLTGDARERGLAHGRGLKDRIHRTIALYGQFFNQPEEQVFETARHFKQVINGFEPDYGTEIEGIADGAEVDPLWIYALNARSEFLSFHPATECTVMHFEGTPFLGQNWDWEEHLEPLIALIRIRREDKPSVLMMTEPGIIGKIGFNSAGVGVCFNFLSIDKPTNGVPIHVLLRAIMDSDSLDAARATIERAGNGRSANVLVADRNGNRFDKEFAATDAFDLRDHGDILAHTNHYVESDFIFPTSHDNSCTRLKRVSELATDFPERNRATMKLMLSDTRNPGDQICQPYRPRDMLGNLGTVCSLAMNLEQGTMDVRLGNNAEAPFERVAITDVLETV